MDGVLRWGRSAYETDEDLGRERTGAVALGLGWQLSEDKSAPAALDQARALVVTSSVRVDRAALERFAGDLLVTTTSGYDHIDLDVCKERRVAVVRLPEARRDAVVEHALAAMLLLLRSFPALQQEAREGRWARSLLPRLAPVGLIGSTVVVVGLGVIGRRAAHGLRGLGARVIGVDPLGVPDGIATLPLDRALARADVVTLHCSLTQSSRGLLSAEALEWLAPSAVVVNTARGEVLDVEAAVGRVRDNRLRGVAVDVFPVEPYGALAAGAAIPGVLFTPHSSGFTRDLGRRVADGVVAALKAWTLGEPLPHRVV
jgi:phosphoglycerate dehydrogenase-like enzyme